MLDRLGNEVDFTELFMEETLSSKDRKELDDSMYGIVYTDENGKKVRKYPLNDEKHVLQAVRFFNKAEEKYKPELARKIVKRAKELDMDYSGWDVLKPYLSKGKNVQEGYVQEGVGLILGAVAVTGVVGALLIALSKKVFNKSITTAKANAAKARININYSQANIKKIIPERAHAYVVNYVNLNDKAWIAFNNSLDSEIDVLTNALNEIAQAPDNSCISKVKALLKTKTGIVQNSTGGPYGAMTNPNQWERFTFINNGKLSTDELLNSEKVIDAIKNEHIKDVDELKKIQDETNQRLLALKKKKEEVEKILEQQPNKKLEKKCVAEIRKRCDFVFKHMIRKSQSIDWAIGKLTNPTYFFQFYDENGNEIGDGPSVGVVEQYMTFEWLDKHFPNSDDSTTGTSDFDERDDDPDDCFSESFEEMFGPVIQEAFDAVTGEEIPIDKAYSLEEMKERTYTEEELKKSKREIKDYLKFANDIAKRIKAQVEKDAKEPTGNQNCLLCTWCAEIGFRGVNKNPRPVYSPCDPIFKVHGENIVRDPMKIIPRGYDNLLEHLADVSQPFARFYVHVNWKGSRGGHEFLLLKVIDDECYIVDAQAGKVDKLSDTHKYFTDINWENSYLCRLDNKNFNRKLFDTMNDPKMTLPWDPKRDIPYMLREGLITKDEAETELKRAETNEFYKVLKEKLGQTPVQESAIGEILNGVNPFSNKRVFHISQDGHLDGQVFKPRVPEYLDKYDPSQDKFEDVENPRVCFSPSIEGCLNAIMVTIGRWKTAEKLREWYVYVPEKPLKEYKHRTNKQLIKEKKVYDANVTDEIWIEEPVRLKQYGIIRIDQVSSKSIKDTVPTTKGFTGHRYKYSFKWHWLVKPKVIADLPYDYSPEEVCKDMIADMEKYKYGLAENGTVHSASAHDYDTKYKLQSPEEFEQNGGGICYDYVEFMEGYLNAYGYDCKKYFISTNTADNDTHTFLLVRDGKGWKDGFIYPESSFKLMEGVYEVKNYEEAALKIMDKIFDVNHNGEKYDEIKYYVWEYSGHPPYGSDMKTCMEYFSKGDPIHEGTAMKIKRKD